MIEQEAISVLKMIETHGVLPTTAKHEAIKALEDIQQYLAIGTVEEIKQKLEELERWHTTEVNPKIKNVFANTSTLICHNCDHKDEYIEELEAEMEEYRAIGTVDECRAAVEKQKEIRNKAIDDFKDAIVQKFTEYDKKGYMDHTNAGIKIKVAEIAEQLKGGGANE